MINIKRYGQKWCYTFIYKSIVYLTTLFQYFRLYIVGKWCWVIVRYSPNIFLEGLRKIK